MKKVTAVVLMLFVCGFISAAAAQVSKLKNGRIVQATQNTTLNYEGVKIAVPQGQTILLGQRDNGSIVLRGFNMDRVQVDSALLSTHGYSVVSYQPASQVAFLNRGEWMSVTDANGASAAVAQHGAISTADAKVTSDTVAAMQAAAAQEVKDAAVELTNELEEVPAFVAETELTNSAREQAAQDVEETLSPSSPR